MHRAPDTAWSALPMSRVIDCAHQAIKAIVALVEADHQSLRRGGSALDDSNTRTRLIGSRRQLKLVEISVIRPRIQPMQTLDRHGLGNDRLATGKGRLPGGNQVGAVIVECRNPAIAAHGIAPCLRRYRWPMLRSASMAGVTPSATLTSGRLPCGVPSPASKLLTRPNWSPTYRWPAPGPPGAPSAGRACAPVSKIALHISEPVIGIDAEHTRLKRGSQDVPQRSAGGCVQGPAGRSGCALSRIHRC